MSPAKRGRAILVAAALIGAATATPAPAAEVHGPTERVSWAARVTLPTPVHARPDAHARRTGHVGTVAAWDGGNVSLLVLAARQDTQGRRWIKVQLPDRPNQRTGSIRADHARVTRLHWRITINLRSRRARAYHDGHLARTWRVVVGKSSTPTPRGHFAVYERVRQPAGSELGPYALHLTAHSNALFNYGGGPGRSPCTAAPARCSATRSAPPPHTVVCA